MTAQVRVFKPRSTAEARIQGVAEPAWVWGSSGLFASLGLADTDADLVEQIRSGLPATVVARLADALGVPQQTLLQVARIAPATFARRRRSASERLSREESDRIYRIAAAYRDALRLFEDDTDGARGWLNTPARALGGETPFARLETEAGAAEVRDLVGRLEHGVYT
jgi:putative toxin-antitoxin system antitoxin component (TIGR02293 family)